MSNNYDHTNLDLDEGFYEDDYNNDYYNYNDFYWSDDYRNKIDEWYEREWEKYYKENPPPKPPIHKRVHIALEQYCVRKVTKQCIHKKELGRLENAIFLFASKVEFWLRNRIYK